LGGVTFQESRYGQGGQLRGSADIILAEELQAEAILIDETAGRAVALQRGLRPLGVLGTLLRATDRGLLREISPLLDRLQKEPGFFISKNLRDDTLKQAGEAE
jgi:predicted nucleic acid-binding protein